MIKTETLLLSSGAAGEAAARIAEHPVTFTRVTVGDGNGHLPTLDVTRTQLDNPVTNGDVAIIAHDLDPNDPTQRVLTLRIDNNADYDARELLIYASADGAEFPHTYIRLGAAYPVRTLANGGVSIEIEAIIKVATEGEFTITVAPATNLVTQGQLSQWQQQLRTQFATQTTVNTAQQRADYAVQFARANQPILTEMHENITAPEARYQTIVRMGGDELFIDDQYQEGDVIMIDNRDTALLTLRGELSFFLPGSPDPVGEITTSLICRFSITATAGGFYITPLWAKET